MKILKNFRHFALMMLLFSFVAAGTLSSCRDQKKETTTEEAGAPESDEHPTEAAADEEHPTEDAGGEEHPTDDSSDEEHPNN
ncbi:hypothetical protein RQM65_17900 [Pricia sp. S334]|uniref:Secreted protein n=1 Tax=Pricia mediterranea TaxID=3076079 RepID=A0ABU3LBV3_9FLAO|nr:hypothetical protein [Pricia sp. S334]MDT7830547.1 hypothetical protein [Pricia sp. S334]